MTEKTSGKQPPLHETIDAVIAEHSLALSGMFPGRAIPYIVHSLELLRKSFVPPAAAREIALRHCDLPAKIQRTGHVREAMTATEVLENLALRKDEPGKASENRLALAEELQNVHEQ